MDAPGRGAGGLGATYLCQGLKSLLLLLAQPPALSCHLFSQRLQLLLQHLNPALQDPPGPSLLSCPSVPRVPSGSHKTTPQQRPLGPGRGWEGSELSSLVPSPLGVSREGMEDLIYRDTKGH